MPLLEAELVEYDLSEIPLVVADSEMPLLALFARLLFVEVGPSKEDEELMLLFVEDGCVLLLLKVELVESDFVSEIPVVADPVRLLLVEFNPSEEGEEPMVGFVVKDFEMPVLMLEELVESDFASERL